MPHDADLLEEALDAWTYVRDGAIAEFANLPGLQWTFRPTEQSRTVADLAQHIIESGLMAAGELSRRDGDFQRQSYPEFIHEYAGRRAHVRVKEPLMDLLRSTHQENIERIRAAGTGLMLQPIMQFSGEPASRLTWLHHAIAHEEYHRGQVALYARLLGHVPALTQLIEGGS